MAFVRAASVDDVAIGRGTLIERDGLTLALLNAGAGRFYACGAVCPHEDGPLADGWVEAEWAWPPPGERAPCPTC